MQLLITFFGYLFSCRLEFQTVKKLHLITPTLVLVLCY